MSAIAKYDGPSARRLSGTALAVRTLSGQTKLLVPVSAAAATAKKHSHHKQILVVPTPGGGARLATVANSSSNSSLLRHTHLHPHHSYSSSSGPSGSMKRDSPSYTYNRDGFKSNSASSSRYNGNHDNSNNSAIDTVQLLRQQQLQQKLLREQYLKSKKEEEMIPEWKRKEDFFAALGLVTKQALKEIQNKKCERKRRTTANPQFSNAAIEAKRINAMEVAAKRAKRKEMAAAERIPSAAPLTRISRRNSQMPILPIQTSSLRSSLRPSTASSSQSNCAPSSSSSFHHKAIFRQFPSSPSTNMTVAPDKSRNLVERLKSRYQLHSSPYQIHNSSSSSHHNSNSNSRSVNLASKSKPIIAKTLHNCYACYETCDPDLDAIMLCKDCRCYFHATCVSSVAEINKTNSVPCPSCDKQTSTTFDGLNPVPAFDDLDPNIERSKKSETNKPIPEGMDEDNEDADVDEDDRSSNLVELDDSLNSGSGSNPKAVTLTLEEIQRKMSEVKKRPIIVMSRADFVNSQAASHSHVSIKAKESLMNRKNEILKLINEGKRRYSELASTLSNLKEDKIKLLQERSKIQDCLKKVTNVIKLVNESDVDKPKPSDVADQTIILEESSESHKKSDESNKTTISPAEDQKTVESDSSSSDDDSSYSEDSDDDEEDDQSNTGKKSIENQKGSPKVVDKDKAVAEKETSVEQDAKVEDSINKEAISQDEIQIASDELDPSSKKNHYSDIKSMKIDKSSSEVSRAVNQLGVSDDVVIEEIVNLGGDEVLISTTEEDEGNLIILDNEPVTLEKCNQFDDETSAAVASIQDQLDADVL